MGSCLPCFNMKMRQVKRTDTALTPAILDEFLQALHRGLAERHYAVIGAAALLKYGIHGQMGLRQTSSVDVLVTFDAKEMFFLALSKRKEFRLTTDIPAQLGYVNLSFNADNGDDVGPSRLAFDPFVNYCRTQRC